MIRVVGLEPRETEAHNDDQDKKDVSHRRHHLELSWSPSSRRTSSGKANERRRWQSRKMLKKKEKRCVGALGLVESRYEEEIYGTEL